MPPNDTPLVPGATAFLLTGPPRAGKSTTLAAAVALLRERGLRPAGFYTSEVSGVDGQRSGFDLVCAATGTRTPLARRDWDTAPARVGSYGVRTDALDAHLAALTTPVTRAGADLVVIDEIGRMQLLHPGFSTAIHTLLGAVPVLGTVHVFDDPVTDAIKARPDVTVLEVTLNNRDRLPDRLVESLVAGP